MNDEIDPLTGKRTLEKPEGRKYKNLAAGIDLNAGSGKPKTKLGKAALGKKQAGLRGDILQEAINDDKYNDKDRRKGLSYDLGNTSMGLFGSAF